MEVIYDNDVPCTQSEGMKRDRMERIVDIYDTGDYVSDQDLRTDTKTQQPVQCRGNVMAFLFFRKHNNSCISRKLYMLYV